MVWIYRKVYFPFLKKALMTITEDLPFRGPREYVEGDFRYSFEMSGDYTYFTRQEKIEYKGKAVFVLDVMRDLVK